MKASRFGLLALLPALACEAPSGPTSIRIQTRSATYAFGTAVTFTIVNGGSRAAYLARCCDVDYALDRWTAGRWATYSSGGCALVCPTDAIELQSHGSYPGSAGVSDTGRYRLHVGVATARSGQPDWSPTSNSFDVR